MHLLKFADKTRVIFASFLVFIFAYGITTYLIFGIAFAASFALVAFNIKILKYRGEAEHQAKMIKEMNKYLEE